VAAGGSATCAILLYVIVETACHAGHLDAARELIDGRQWVVTPNEPGVNPARLAKARATWWRPLESRIVPTFPGLLLSKALARSADRQKVFAAAGRNRQLGLLEP
jgi:hypothetical protein